MSNRTLILAIVLIILAAGGLAGYFYWQQTKPLVVTEEQINNAKTPTPTPTNTNQMTDNFEDCKRNFDQAKLSANSGLKLTARQVEIDVRGFGKMVLEFFDKDAPKAVENFLRLTDAGYYDCITFHRVAKGFVIQGGDPTGTGGGGESAFGSAFQDELDASTKSYQAGYKKGVLAMANSGPNTNGSQFFIMLDTVPLDHNYTIFGQVVSGLDVVEKIGQVAITPKMGPTDGSPVEPVVMQSVKIIK